MCTYITFQCLMFLGTCYTYIYAAKLYFYLFTALAGGDPKPQQNVRVVPVPHSTNTNYRTRQKEYPHHMRRDHQQFRNKDRKGIQKQKPKQEDKFRLWKEGPNFDTDLRQNVYAQEGQTAVLTCRVYDRGNKTVSVIKYIAQFIF